MSYITEIFERLDIQQIREFLLHGNDCPRLETQNYKERLEESNTSATEILKQKLSDTNEYEEVLNYLQDNETTIQNVYMEIGLQCGFKLAMHILNNKE